MARITRRILSITFALVAVVAFAGSEADDPAPQFRAKTLSGETFTNQNLKGKVALLQFWTTWCPYCRGEQSLVDDINSEFADKGLIVLAVDVGESKKTVKKYLAQHPRSCRIVLNEDTNLAAMYAANVYPIYVVIDRSGNIAGTQRGAAGQHGLRRLLGQAGLGSDESKTSFR